MTCWPLALITVSYRESQESYKSLIYWYDCKLETIVVTRAKNEGLNYTSVDRCDLEFRIL